MEFVILSVKCSGNVIGIGVGMVSRTGMLRWVLMLNGMVMVYNENWLRKFHNLNK